MKDRYAQCDDTCTVDCGACKGAGHPAAPAAEADLREQMVACLVAARTRPRLAAATVDALLAGPLHRLVEQAAEARRLRAVVERVKRLCGHVEDGWSPSSPRLVAALRRVLDGDGTDG